MDIIDHLRTFSSTQRRLVFALCELESVNQNPGLAGVPQQGTLPSGDEFWEFQKHGAGVSFNQLGTRTVIDAHIEMFDVPDGLDAWRLVQYFESLGIETVGYQDESFDVTTERKIKALLARLSEDGLLSSSPNLRGIYRLREKNSERAAPCSDGSSGSQSPQ